MGGRLSSEAAAQAPRQTGPRPRLAASHQPGLASVDCREMPGPGVGGSADRSVARGRRIARLLSCSRQAIDILVPGGLRCPGPAVRAGPDRTGLRDALPQAMTP